jgi:hypothetical protein
MVFLDLNCILLLREFEVLDIFGPALIRRHGPHDPTFNPATPILNHPNTTARILLGISTSTTLVAAALIRHHQHHPVA